MFLFCIARKQKYFIFFTSLSKYRDSNQKFALICVQAQTYTHTWWTWNIKFYLHTLRYHFNIYYSLFYTRYQLSRMPCHHCATNATRDKYDYSFFCLVLSCLIPSAHLYESSMKRKKKILTLTTEWFVIICLHLPFYHFIALHYSHPNENNVFANCIRYEMIIIIIHQCRQVDSSSRLQ